MRHFIAFLSFLVVGQLIAIAQLFSSKEFQHLHYEVPSQNGSSDVTVIEVDRMDNGDVRVLMENVQFKPDEVKFDGKIVVRLIGKYEKETNISTITIVTADDIKALLLQGLKTGVEASGNVLTDEQLAEIEAKIAVKGQLDLVIDPGAAEDSKLPVSNMSVNIGPVSMSMNLWDGIFHGFETVKTDAGTFDCVKVSYTIRTKTMAGIEKEYVEMWFAEGIGCVRSLSKKDSSDEPVEEILVKID